MKEEGDGEQEGAHGGTLANDPVGVNRAPSANRAGARLIPRSPSLSTGGAGYFTSISFAIPCTKCGLPSLASGTKQSNA